MAHIKPEYIKEALAALQSGVFMVSGKNPPDIMSLNWGSVGVYWNRPVIVAPVRYSRYTYDLVDAMHEFAISIPRTDLSNELEACTHVSGRDHNKFHELNLHPTHCRHIDTYIVQDCALHLECKVIYKAGMETFQLVDEHVKSEFYTNRNFHSMFFAEIIDAYEY